MQWTGSGTVGGDPNRPVTVTMPGATVVEVHEAGKVTRWRDYLDTGESMKQIKAAFIRRRRVHEAWVAQCRNR